MWGFIISRKEAMDERVWGRYNGHGGGIGGALVEEEMQLC